MDFFNFLSFQPLASLKAQAPAVSFDTAVVLLIFVAGVLYGLRLQKKRLILLLISLYVSIAIVSLLPFSERVIEQTSLGEEVVSLALLGIFAMAAYYILAGSVLKTVLPIPKWKKEGFWHVVILSLATTGFFVSTVLAVAQPLLAERISQVTHQVFLTDTARLIWLFAPLVALRMVARYSRR